MSIEVEKKKPWKIGKLALQPIFEINDKQGVEHKEVECKTVMMSLGKDDYAVDYEALFMFVYFCANEELRQMLALKYERKISYIPYEVTFKLDPDEQKRGSAKRRIELPVDEVSMAYAKNLGWEAFIKNKFGTQDFSKMYSQLSDKGRTINKRK